MGSYFNTFRISVLFSVLMMPFFLNGQSYQYLHFDKVNDDVLLDGAGQFVSDTDEISMTGWFFCDQLSYGQGYMGFRVGTGDGEFYLIQLNNGVMECRLKSTTGLHQYVSPENTAVAQEWQHFAWVYDGSSVILYVNGVEIGSATASGTFSSETVPFGIGISNLPGFNFVFGGGIDEVSVWDKGLTQSEVQDIMSIELVGNETNLQLYYKFNQGIPEGDNTAISQLECEIGGTDRDADLNDFALTGTSSNFLGATLNPEFSTSGAEICVTDSVMFTDLTPEEITNWNWTFEGGDPASSTDQNPTVTYNNTGSFDVSLFVYDGENYTTVVFQDYITVLATPGDANVPEGSLQTCQEMDYEYSADEVEFATSYEWMVEPSNAGVFSGTESTTNFTTSDTYTGSYTISVRGINDCAEGAWSSELQCELSLTPAAFDLAGDLEFCEGTAGVDLSLSGSQLGVNYELYLDNVATGQIEAGNGSEITFASITEEGIYTCYASFGECDVMMNSELAVQMNALPAQGNMPQGIAELCNDTITNYVTNFIESSDTILWTLDPAGAGALSWNNLEATIDWDDSFNGMAFLSVHGENDCGTGLDSDILVISVGANPQPDISGFIGVCVEEEATYSSDMVAGLSYSWEVEGGDVVAGAGTNTITVLWGVSGQGVVRLTEETSGGCSTTTEDYDVNISDCSSVKEISQHGIHIFPNPASDRLVIKSDDAIKSVLVYNANGELVSTLYPQSTAVDFKASALRSGLYLFKIETESGIVSKSIMID